MKRFLTLLITACLLLSLLCGCCSDLLAPTEPPVSLGTNLDIFPVYENLTADEKTIYDGIRTAIGAHSEELIHIGTYSTEEELENAEKRLDKMFRQVVYSCPDYFWVNLYHYQFQTAETKNGYELKLKLQYIMGQEEAAEKNKLYEARVNAIVESAQQIPDLFTQVLFVHDYILSTTKYDKSLAESNDNSHLDLSAYGCLVNGNTICSGYALAFRSIMQRLGIECGVEFNTYAEITLANGHVWNYCKLDGEYYYFDLTWDDTGFDSDTYRPYLEYSHLYFGITSDDLALATYDLDPNAPTPDCTGKAYNYFIYQGLNFESYSFDAVKPVIQSRSEEKAIFLRFDSYYELEQAKIDLIDNQRIFDILDVDELQYVVSDTDLHLLLLIG